MTERIPAEAFPPGEYIEEYLEDRHWTQGELAVILGCPVSAVNDIVTGKIGLTPAVAEGLAGAFGTSASLWLNLDSAYRLWMSRQSKNPAAAEASIRI